MTLQVLETTCEWRAKDVADPSAWTEVLAPAEIAEIEAAMAHARNTSAEVGCTPRKYDSRSPGRASGRVL